MNTPGLKRTMITAAVLLLASSGGHGAPASGFSARDGSPPSVGNRDSSPSQCNWSTEFGPNSMDGPIYALAPLPPHPGMIIAGGAFKRAGTVAASNVAAFWNHQWIAMDKGLTAPVRRLVGYNGTVVAEGDFGIRQWSDSEGWQSLGTPSFHPGPWTLLTWNGTLMAGGADGAIFRRDAGRWRQLAQDFPFAEPVNAMVEFAGLLAVAGDSHLSLWYGDGWQTFPSEFAPTQDLPGLMALAVYEYKLVAAGSFAWSDTSRYLAWWDGWHWRPFGAGVDGPVHRLTVVDGKLYVMGDFSTAGGVEAHQVAVWDGVAWEDRGPGMNRPVHAVLSMEDRTYVGGEFTPAGTVAADYLAYWEDGRWKGMGNVLDGEVSAFLNCDTVLVAGGAFERAGGVFGHHIAAWNGLRWQPMGAGFDDRVWALARHEGRIVAGGAFKSSGAQRTPRVAVWNGARWEPLGEGMDLPVFSLLSASDGSLYAAGAFTRSGDEPVAHIARWSGDGWEPVGGGCDDWVTDLAEWKGRIYAAGFFEHAGDSTASRIAEWDGRRWRAISGEMDRSWSVTSLEAYGDRLAVGGNFGRIGDVAVTNLAAWNGTGWSSLAGAYVRLTSVDHILALHAVGTMLFMGTYGLELSDGPGSRLAMYDVNWSTFGSFGPNGSAVTAIGDWGGHLFVGGTFNACACGYSYHIAEWSGLQSRVGVELLAFTAARQNDEAVIRWVLADEADELAGIVVHREDANGSPVPLAGELPPANGSGEVRDPAPPLGETAYWLLARSRTGESTWYGPAILPAWGPRASTTLEQNAPNPVMTTTAIRFAIAAPGHVRLRIFDAAGRVVATPLDAPLDRGPHQVIWDTRGDSGNLVARGVYFYRLEGPAGSRGRRLMVLR